MLCFRNDFPISSQVTCTNGNTSAIKAHQLAAGDFLSHRPGQCDADADKMHFDIKVFARKACGSRPNFWSALLLYLLFIPWMPPYISNKQALILW